MAQLVDTRNGGFASLQDDHRFALFSGGHDSLVATHKSITSGEANCVVHIDTGIGIPETKDYIQSVVDEFGWPFVSITSDFEYDEIVRENQFPGPAVHIIMYSKLKERALRLIPRHSDEKPHFYTGVRRYESDVRFREIDDTIMEAGQWVWHSPIHDFTAADVEAYIQEHDLPKNPVKMNYHHSGECLCGAFGNRTEELTLLEAHYPDTAERIKELESAVQDLHGTDDPQSYWGHGGMASNDLRALLADNDDSQMMLCQSCESQFNQGE